MTPHHPPQKLVCLENSYAFLKTCSSIPFHGPSPTPPPTTDPPTIRPSWSPSPSVYHRPHHDSMSTQCGSHTIYSHDLLIYQSESPSTKVKAVCRQEICRFVFRWPHQPVYQAPRPKGTCLRLEQSCRGLEVPQHSRAGGGHGLAPVSRLFWERLQQWLM